MTREEMINAIRRLERAEGEEHELDALLDSLIAVAPHASIGDLIYHTHPELSAEQIVDEALKRERSWSADGVDSGN